MKTLTSYSPGQMAMLRRLVKDDPTQPAPAAGATIGINQARALQLITQDAARTVLTCQTLSTAGSAARAMAVTLMDLIYQLDILQQQLETQNKPKG